MRLNKLQQTAVTALEDIKARDIKVLDVRKITSFYDSMIIATAESNRQVKALAHHVRDKLKEAGATIIGVEGEETGDWVLVDCGDIVVHVMQPAVRAYYNLEELWQSRRRRALARRPPERKRGPRSACRTAHPAATGEGNREATHRRARSPDARVGGGRLCRIREAPAAANTTSQLAELKPAARDSRKIRRAIACGRSHAHSRRVRRIHDGRARRARRRRGRRASWHRGCALARCRAGRRVRHRQRGRPGRWR